MVHYSSFARHVFLLLYTYMENKNIVPNFYLNKALVQSRLGVRLPKSGFARICLFPTFWRGLSRVCLLFVHAQAINRAQGGPAASRLLFRPLGKIF
jgi:hypothetical protein